MMSVTPFAAQVAISLALIGRDAWAMSDVSTPTPAQKSRIPPEDPPEEISGAGPEKFAATASANGRTVDEPAATTLSRATAEPAAATIAAVIIGKA